MASALTPAEQRVADALAAHGLPGTVIVLEQLATTAQMAAEPSASRSAASSNR